MTGNVKYSRKLSFAEQVDATLNNELDRNTSVYVMETPEMLQSLGLKEYPMLMTQRHIMDINHAKSNKNDHWHGIPDSTIKQLPNAIENPLVIMRSAKQNGDIVLVTSLFDTDGLPVLVSIHPDGKGQYNRTEIASNFITSMYGKKGFGNFIQSAVGDKRVLYNNAKRTRNLFSKVGLQLPNLLKQDGFFDTNISQTPPTVKSKNKLASKKSSTMTKDSNGKTLTEAQAEYFKDSKVRDENGNLRVVYHGTGADFTVFDKSKVGQNYSNRGGDLGFYVSPCIVFPGRRNAKTAKKESFAANLRQSKKRKPWNH